MGKNREIEHRLQVAGFRLEEGAKHIRVLWGGKLVFSLKRTGFKRDRGVENFIGEIRRRTGVDLKKFH